MKVKEESEKVGLTLNVEKTKIIASSPITSWQIDGETMETMRDFIFWGSKIIADGDCSHQIKRHMLLGRKSYDKPRQRIKKQRHYFVNRCHLIKAMVFPVVMYGCKSWTINKAEYWRIDAFKLWCWRRLESPLNSKEIKPVNHKGNQPWIFIARTDAEAPTLWPPDAKSPLTRKDPDAGKDWGQEEKGMKEDEMVRWHHWLNGHEFEQALGDGEGQGSLACCSPRVAESDMTEWLNNIKCKGDIKITVFNYHNTIPIL